MERAAQAKGDWPWLFGLRDAAGAVDLVDLWDRAIARLAARLGLPAPPTGDSPALDFMSGRRSRWHDHLEERMVAAGMRDLFHDVLQEFARSVGFPPHSPDPEPPPHLHHPTNTG